MKLNKRDIRNIAYLIVLVVAGIWGHFFQTGKVNPKVENIETSIPKTGVNDENIYFIGNFLVTKIVDGYFERVASQTTDQDGDDSSNDAPADKAAGRLGSVKK